MRTNKIQVTLSPDMRSAVEEESRRTGFTPSNVLKAALADRYKSILEPKRSPGRPRVDREPDRVNTCDECGEQKTWSNKLMRYACGTCEPEPEPEQSERKQVRLYGTCPTCGGAMQPAKQIEYIAECSTCGTELCATCGGRMRWKIGGAGGYTCDTCNPEVIAQYVPGYTGQKQQQRRVPLARPPEPEPIEDQF